jgi:CheY-like chemotaxis protein
MLVDDIDALRRLIALSFDLEPDYEVVGQVTDMAEALDLAASARPDLIVVDARIAGGTSFDRIADLRAACKGAKVVVYSGEPPERAAKDAYQAGADAYIQKGSVRDLLDGISKLLAFDPGGSSWMPDPLCAVVAHGMLNTLTIVRGAASTLAVSADRLDETTTAALTRMITEHSEELRAGLGSLPAVAAHRVLNELAPMLHSVDLLSRHAGAVDDETHSTLLKVVAAGSPEATRVLGDVVRGLPPEAIALLNEQNHARISPL